MIAVPLQMLQCGNANLSDVKHRPAAYIKTQAKEIKMLKKLYRSIVIARAGSAAAQVVYSLSDKQLADIGINRHNYAETLMREIEADFAAKDIAATAKKTSQVPFAAHFKATT